MALSARAVRAQLSRLQPLLSSCSLKTLRRGQNLIGQLVEARHREYVTIKDHPFANFTGAWVIPKDERRQGVILYLHGGGYTCGGLDYAKGFGSTLADVTGTRTFCPAYRLAPEHPYPAAVEDALEAYRYLLAKGYQQITLCGESAGGGLCYTLCLKLRELGLPLPQGIIAISPWTDMTASGPSYEENKDADPTITAQTLSFYADAYTQDRTDPMVSPLLASLEGMPPSLIFVGGDEIMLSDSQLLHEKLLAAGCRSRLTVAPDRWHGYVLYALEEDKKDLAAIDRFLSKYMAQANKLRWLRLDNAAKIYPAARRQNWSNVFRQSVTLREAVDPAVLQSALDVTARRFPSIAARLRRGVFWYYLQQLDSAPAILPERSYPLTRMDRASIRQCAFRVLYYRNRIAVEFFHSLTDGNGALVFLKSLTAEYLQQKHGIRIPACKGVLGRLEDPSDGELEDSFQKYGGPMSAPRREYDAWPLTGTPEKNGFLHVTCFRLPVAQVLEKAHEYDITLTAFLAAVTLQALQELQQEKVPDQKKRMPLKVLIPVNLRKLFPSDSLRNFAMYTTPELLPRLGPYSFREICQIVRHKMGLDITPKQMSMKITTNVRSERIMAVKLMPLFIKNAVMKAVFNSVGERKSCLTLSNLGAVQLPEEMEPYVERFDFILGIQASAPYNCGVLSYGGELTVNFIRNIREPDLESHFFRVLRDMGLPVQVQSNGPGEF